MFESNNEIRQIKVSWGTGINKVEVAASVCGKDIVVFIGGGTRYHIGAVALAVPRPSLTDQQKISATASVLCVTGHKEDQLARSAALRISAALNCVVTVVAGLHIDEAKMEDIGEMENNNVRAIEKLIEDLSSR
jgi:hypothetical protein